MTAPAFPRDIAANAVSISCGFEGFIRNATRARGASTPMRQSLSGSGPQVQEGDTEGLEVGHMSRDKRQSMLERGRGN